MMDSTELIILDVGHGNCAILRDTETVPIIDCPPSSTLVNAREWLGIETVNNVLISHSDVDHAGGLPTLLGSVFVENVYINPDANKKGAHKGRLWKGKRIALQRAEQGGTTVYSQLTSTMSKKSYCSIASIEI